MELTKSLIEKMIKLQGKSKDFPFDCKMVATSSNEVNYVNPKIDVNFIHRTSVKDCKTSFGFSEKNESPPA